MEFVGLIFADAVALKKLSEVVSALNGCEMNYMYSNYGTTK